METKAFEGKSIVTGIKESDFDALFEKCPKWALTANGKILRTSYGLNEYGKQELRRLEAEVNGFGLDIFWDEWMKDRDGNCRGSAYCSGTMIALADSESVLRAYRKHLGIKPYRKPRLSKRIEKMMRESL
jgi:hypothetical protein